MALVRAWLTNPCGTDHARLEDVDTALGHRSHRQLGLTGDPDLAHDDDVERSAELAGYGRRHRHASSWEPEHHDRRAHAMAQLRREPMSRVVAVREGPHGTRAGARCRRLTAVSPAWQESLG